MEVLIESLKRIEQQLQGETPAAIFLWNEWGTQNGRQFKPKREVDFADYLKLHLDDDIGRRGIIANREVEIRRGRGGAAGEQTDIHVDASAQRDHQEWDRISVIIEVKGCWNRELTTAMETQLVRRYLAENKCRHGLYVVGWFHCPQWIKPGHQHPSHLEGIRQSLDQQAASLSSHDLMIRSLVLDVSLR